MTESKPLRRLPNWIAGFEAFAATYNSTPLFSRWGAVWMLGTAVTRAIGMRARGSALHPNFFIQLVGGPGTGKSQTVKAVRACFFPATGMSAIPASITRAGLEDYMQGNMQNRKGPDGKLILSNECIGLSEEMQGILPDQDLGHLTLYNILYDLPSIHKARTRSNGEVNLESPYCSILTGAQPAFLATTMPEQAWGMGFMSRSVMVFDQPRERKSMFETVDVDHKLLADLIHDLKIITGTHGWMSWAPEAVALYNEWWVKQGGLPIPQAKRLAMGYNARRELHMVKLAMAFSLSRTMDLRVEISDVAGAIELLLLTEERMRHIFSEMSNTGSMVAIEDALDMVKNNAAAGKETSESDLVNNLMQRFPPGQVFAVIENLLSSNALKVSGGIGAKGFRKFTVGDRSAIM
jgi:hypothetical protein